MPTPHANQVICGACKPLDLKAAPFAIAARRPWRAPRMDGLIIARRTGDRPSGASPGPSHLLKRPTAVRLTARGVLEWADLAGACGRKWVVSI
jgi:hypothetical protein